MPHLDPRIDVDAELEQKAHILLVRLCHRLMQIGHAMAVGGKNGTQQEVECSVRYQDMISYTLNECRSAFSGFHSVFEILSGMA